MYKFYLPAGVNEVTGKYVGIIEEALNRQGAGHIRVADCRAVTAEDIAVVIDSAAFRDIYRRNRKQRIVMWAQGIFPEETDMTYPPGIKQFLRKKYWRVQERRAILNASFLFFVSEEMKRHYQKVYGYRGDNYLVMPCFNSGLDEAAFSVKGKYDCPSFLYTGGLNAWQCIEETVFAYKAIAEVLPGSSLTLFTRQQEEARKIVDRAGLKEVEIRSVPLERMEKEQRKYKYGFLLRRDTEVNRVATPTKLNSYMASGIIPIMSDVMAAFRENLADVKHIVRVGDVGDSRAIAKEVLAFEKRNIEPSELLAEYRNVFGTFYNEEKYIKLIVDKLKLWK